MMWSRIPRLGVSALVVSLLAVSAARADLMLIPAGLNPGDQFRVVYISSATGDATSSNIADYDLFITNLAVAAGIDTYFGAPVTWQVLGSTATVSAITRVPFSSPALYRLDGVKVADSGSDLWDGSINTPIDVTEGGIVSPRSSIWTGTTVMGTSGGSTALGGSSGATIAGMTGNTTQGFWVSRPPPPLQPTQLRLYGVSSVLTVPQQPAVIPEPTSLTLVLVSIGGLAGSALARRRRRAAPPP